MIWTGSPRCTRFTQWLYALSAIVLAIIVVVLLFTINRNSAGRFVKDWRYIMDAYINEEASITGTRGVVREVVRAKEPYNFVEKLELLTFGEGTHFAVQRQPGAGYGEIITQTTTANDARLSKRPIPYPPQSLWCVYLEYDNKRDVVIFIGYHIDMYSAEWIAHIGEQTPFSPSFHDLVSRLECDIQFTTE